MKELVGTILNQMLQAFCLCLFLSLDSLNFPMISSLQILHFNIQVSWFFWEWFLSCHSSLIVNPQRLHRDDIIVVASEPNWPYHQFSLRSKWFVFHILILLTLGLLRSCPYCFSCHMVEIKDFLSKLKQGARHSLLQPVWGVRRGGRCVHLPSSPFLLVFSSCFSFLNQAVEDSAWALAKTVETLSVT